MLSQQFHQPRPKDRRIPKRRPACHAALAIVLLATSCAVTSTHGQEAKQIGKSKVANLWTRKVGEDWPQFLGRGRDGKSSETGFRPNWKQTPPQLVYAIRVGEGYGACTVSQGRMLHFDRVGGKNRLRCFHAEKGDEIWKHEYETDYEDHYGYDGGPRCSPLIDGDRVYTMDANGVVYCLALRDGKVHWHLDTRAKFGVIQNFFGAGSNPVIHGDLLIMMVGGSPANAQNLLPGQLMQAKGNGTGIVAVNKFSGEQTYAISDELASYASLKLATLDDRPWCFGFMRGGLLGFHPQTGKIDFHFPWRADKLESVNASTPVLLDDEVLISETYGPGAAMLKARAGKDPQVVWQDELKSRDKALQTHWNTPIVHKGRVYACSGRHSANAELRCVDWKSGKVLWSEPKLSRTSLTYLDGHLLCQGEYGVLRVLKANPEKFDEVALLPMRLEYPCWAAPVVSHGLMWVRGEGVLACIDIIPQE